MPIRDRSLELTNKTEIPKTEGIHNLGYTLDISYPDRKAKARQMYLDIRMNEAVTSAGDAGVQFKLVSSTKETPEKDGAESVHIVSEKYGKAKLDENFHVSLQLPLSHDYKRYIGVQAVVSGAALTGGKVTCEITRVDVTDLGYQIKEGPKATSKSKLS